MCNTKTSAYQAGLHDHKPGSRVRQADVEHAARVVRCGCHAALRCCRDAVRQPAEVAEHLHPHPVLFDDAALLHCARLSFMPQRRAGLQLESCSYQASRRLDDHKATACAITLICPCVAAAGTICKQQAQCCGRITTCRMASSLRSARSMSTATSAALRLKFSRLKAYTLTHGTPSSKHHSNACTSCARVHSVHGESEGAPRWEVWQIAGSPHSPCEHSQLLA